MPTLVVRRVRLAKAEEAYQGTLVMALVTTVCKPIKINFALAKNSVFMVLHGLFQCANDL